MNTTTNTLTDRYVWAAARTLPEAQRAEFERELRERIGDQIDALVDHGRSPSDAERSVLHDLGDPAALAAGYVDRPLYLIGPRYFLTWWHLMKLMYTVVLPLAAGAIVLAQLLSEASIGEVIGSSVATVLAIAVHLGFWITLAFAVIERMPNATLPTLWETEMLPSLPDLRRSSRLGEFIASTFFLVLLAAGIVWQQFSSIYTDAAGQPIPLLDPALWSSWLPYFLGLLALEVLFAVAVYAWGWNWWLAASNLVLNVAFVVPALWLFTAGRLFNDAYLDAAGWPWGEAGPIIVTIVVVVVVASSSWDVIDGVIKTARARSARRASVG